VSFEQQPSIRRRPLDSTPDSTPLEPCNDIVSTGQDRLSPALDSMRFPKRFDIISQCTLARTILVKRVDAVDTDQVR
jgi:hypothetical protein